MRLNCSDGTDASVLIRKRKIDPLSRLASSGTPRGRSSESGWTYCPLCGNFSKKKYLIGRGIAAHLEAIHTPWRPSKLALKIARRRREQLARAELRPTARMNDAEQEVQEGNIVNHERIEPWEPTQQEVDEWNKQMLEIIKEVERVNHKPGETNLDRTGKPVKKYKESLPPFLEAASRGNIKSLRAMADKATKEGRIFKLLQSKDRHMSTADHWAAGGGHIECLKFLLQLRSRLERQAKTHDGMCKKVRRRDGKTCLHYAARNGHVNCVRYLIDKEGFWVDEASGDGSTPLHIACYGGHPSVARYLVSRGADPLASNEWGCTAAHWAGMTISTSESDIRELCSFLLENKVSFVAPQCHGHTALHKAAQRKNKHVIQWLADKSYSGGAGLSDREREQAGMPDNGGHKPSAIWGAVGGDIRFGDWVKSLGW